jgi:hypothetical protein
MPLPEKCCFTSLFATGYKRLAEGESKAFWMKRAFGVKGGSFGCGRLLDEGKLFDEGFFFLLKGEMNC